MTTDTFTLISFWAVLIVPCLLLVIIVWQHQEWLKRKEEKAQREFDARVRAKYLKELEETAASSIRKREFRDRLSYEETSKKIKDAQYKQAISNTQPLSEDELRRRHPLHGFVPNPDPSTNTIENPFAFGGKSEGEFAGAGASSSWSAAGLGEGAYPTPTPAPSYFSSSSSSSSDDGGSSSYSSSSSCSSSSSSSDSGSSSCSSSD